MNGPIVWGDPVGTDCICLYQRVRGDHVCYEDNDEDDFIPVYSLYSEHHKKGTTNPSNRQKHDGGERRRNRDARGERGDKKREDRSNHRHRNEKKNDNKIVAGVALVASVLVLGYLVINDVTGVGVADDWAIAPTVQTFFGALATLFG